MRRLISAALAVCAVGAVAPVATAMADAPPVSQFQYAIDSDAVAQNYAWNSAATAAAAVTASQEHVVILQSWETDELQAIKAANPNAIVLMYENASSASSSAAWDGLYSTGVSYQQAQSSGWLLDNTSGQPFTFEGYNWLYATDIGSTGYQNAWAQNVVSELNSAPWSGVFMDDVNPTIKYHYPVNEVAKYPSDALYSAAMGSFLQKVGPQIQADGKLAIANIGSWSSYGSTVDPWLHYLSGGMDEQFLKWGTTAGTGYANEATWQIQLGEVALAQSENKLFLGVTHSAATDEHAAVYSYATELLAGDGDTDTSLAYDYTTANVFPEYAYQIGQPTGNYSVTSNGVYERAFTSGLALVNPSGSTETVSLGGTYSGSGLSNVSTVTMAPDTGLVLTSNGTSGSTGSGSGSASGGGSGGSASGSGSSASSGSSGSSGTSGSSGSSGSSGTSGTSGTSGSSGSSGTSGSSGSSGPSGSSTGAVRHTRHWYYERWLARHRKDQPNIRIAHARARKYAARMILEYVADHASVRA
jgi:hypothetical protein